MLWNFVSHTLHCVVPEAEAEIREPEDKAEGCYGGQIPWGQGQKYEAQAKTRESEHNAEDKADEC